MRASDANGANKGTALVKTSSIHACDEGRSLFVLRKTGFLRVKNVLERQKEEEEAPLHRLLENPACLSILAFKDDRVRREIAVASELPL